MGWSVDRVLREFDSHQLSEWQWYYDQEPWGGEMDNLRAGTIATATLASNPYRGNSALPLPDEWFGNGRRVTEDGEVITGNVVIQTEAEQRAVFERYKHRKGA